MNISAIGMLFRAKPTIAWAVMGTVLGLSVAINETGFNLNWDLLFLSFLAIVVIQAFLSHSLNDLFDEEVDKDTDLKNTSRSKVLVNGFATRNDLIITSIASLLFVLIAVYVIYTKLGIVTILFALVGIYAPIAYSVAPLKFGWRPFSEWSVIFPTLISLIVGVNFVATGNISMLAVYVSIIFALFGILFFVVSRIMDYIPDKLHGKKTTIVKYGLRFAASYMHSIIFISLVLSFSFMIYVNMIFIIPLLLWLFELRICGMPYESRENLIYLSKLRVRYIYISYANSILLSIVLIVF